MKLTDAHINQKLQITNLVGNADYNHRLYELGMIEGCEICPLRNSNTGIMLVDVRGCRYALSKEVAECVIVKPQESNNGDCSSTG